MIAPLTQPSPHRPSAPRSRRRLTLATVPALSLALAAPTLAAPPGTPGKDTAAAAPLAAAADACPRAVPISDVVVGERASGLTVAEGTKPTRFSADVKGVLKDGLAPGVDLIVVDTDSPEIRKVGGIWAGMSGSPVYTRDGRLIGAIAYGLSRGPSRTAGVTPAGPMLSMLSGSETAGEASGARLILPQPLQRQLVASGAASAPAAASGLTRLPVPMAVSGVGESRLPQVQQALTRARLGPFEIYRAAAGESATPASTSKVEAGGNLAVALSSGDVTAAAVGTTTAVCNGKAVGFGHPFTGLGSGTAAARLGDALYVQSEPVGAPYKVANVTDVVGTVDQDRLPGVRALLGNTPPAVPVTSTVSVSGSAAGSAAGSGTGGRRRDGTTRAHATSLLPAVALFHLISNIDGVQQRIGPGTATITWDARGTTGSGQPWRLTRSNRFASNADIAGDSSAELIAQLSEIESNPFAEPSYGSVHIVATVDDLFRQYQVAKVYANTGAGLRLADPDTPLTVKPGAALPLRVVLMPYRGRGVLRKIDLRFVVPRGYAGQTGNLQVGAGPVVGGPDVAQAWSYGNLLVRLRAQPRQDELVARLTFTTQAGKPVIAQQSRLMDQAVAGSLTYTVQVTGG